MFLPQDCMPPIATIGGPVFIKKGINVGIIDSGINRLYPCQLWSGTVDAFNTASATSMVATTLRGMDYDGF